MLSVVAQQILSILTALAQRLTRFIFDGTSIPLVHTCGIFITMNPGYAGRTELPDNLKAMFRPISMMVPDSSMIAEINLFSEGFRDTRLLAKKVTRDSKQLLIVNNFINYNNGTVSLNSWDLYASLWPIIPKYFFHIISVKRFKYYFNVRNLLNILLNASLLCRSLLYTLSPSSNLVSNTTMTSVCGA